MSNLRTIIALRTLATSIVETNFTKRFKKLSKKKQNKWRKNIIEAKKYLRDSERECLSLKKKLKINLIASVKKGKKL